VTGEDTFRLSGKEVTDRMFSIQQINDLHDRLGNMETFAQYVQARNSQRESLPDVPPSRRGKPQSAISESPARRSVWLSRGNSVGGNRFDRI